MFKFLLRILHIKPYVPDVGLTPREIDINLTPQSQAALRRHAGRLSRILTLKKTSDLKAEINLRQRALVQAGFNIPESSGDATRILKNLEVSHGYHS